MQAELEQKQLNPDLDYRISVFSEKCNDALLPSLDRKTLRRLYNSKFKELGLVSGEGFKHTKIYKALKGFFGEKYLADFDGRKTAGSSPPGWLKRALTTELSGAYIFHTIILLFLFGDFSSFISAYIKLLDIRLPKDQSFLRKAESYLKTVATVSQDVKQHVDECPKYATNKNNDTAYSKYFDYIVAKYGVRECDNEEVVHHRKSRMANDPLVQEKDVELVNFIKQVVRDELISTRPLQLTVARLKAILPATNIGAGRITPGALPKTHIILGKVSESNEQYYARKAMQIYALLADSWTSQSSMESVSRKRGFHGLDLRAFAKAHPAIEHERLKNVNALGIEQEKQQILRFLELNHLGTKDDFHKNYPKNRMGLLERYDAEWLSKIFTINQYRKPSSLIFYNKVEKILRDEYEAKNSARITIKNIAKILNFKSPAQFRKYMRENLALKELLENHIETVELFHRRLLRNTAESLSYSVSAEELLEKCNISKYNLREYDYAIDLISSHRL
jgi:hypothetical protein